MEEDNQTKESNKGFKIIGIIFCIIVVIFIGLSLWQIPYTERQSYSESVPYQENEYFTERVPYQDIEYYQDTVNSKSCDSVRGCSCLHWSYLGLGACDSCTCQKTREITKYRDEQRTREITKYKDVTKYRDVTKYCSALNTIFNNCG